MIWGCFDFRKKRFILDKNAANNLLLFQAVKFGIFACYPIDVILLHKHFKYSISFTLDEIKEELAVKMEILDNRTITILISEAELSTLGYDHRNHESNLGLIHHFVDEALLFAESTQGFPATQMPSHTEVAFLPSQGISITITLTEDPEGKAAAPQEDRHDRTSLLFTFRDFEDVALCGAKMPERLRGSGKLYAYKGTYRLLLQETDFALDDDYQNATSIVSEYADRNEDVSVEIVAANGKTILEKDALKEIARLFPC
jgi:hypothetical protein